MRPHFSWLGCLSLLICLDATAQFSNVNCPAEVFNTTPGATCAVRTSFSFLIFGSTPADTPAQACTFAANLLTQSSNINTTCKFEAAQNSCSCIEADSGMSNSWSVDINPDSLMPACPADFHVAPRTRLPVTASGGFTAMMPVCVGPGKNPPPVTPPCPVSALKEMTDPAAIQHERGKFVAGSDLARLSSATMAGQACMLERVDKTTVFPVAGYRPAEFQAHLKELWDKWHGLLNNTNPACKAIKEDLRREWLKHKLVRDPLTSPHHVSGEAVDIAGLGPANGDALAANCGMMRPDPVASPLHFQPGRK